MSLSLRPFFYPSTSFFDPFLFDTEGAEEDGGEATGKDASKQQVASTRQQPPDFLTTFSNLGPKTDIHDCGDHVAVSVELPGVPRDAIHISLDEKRRLTISGEFKSSYETPTPTSGEGEQQQQQQQQDGGDQAAAKQHRPRPLVTERTYGSFSRSFILPRSVNTDGEVKATFDNGLLKINIPKQPKPAEKQPRAIAIQ